MRVVKVVLLCIFVILGGLYAAKSLLSPEVSAKLGRYASYQLNINGAYYANARALERLKAEVSKQPFWSFRISELKPRLQTEAWIDEVSITRSYFPLALEISIEEAQPWIIVELPRPGGNQTWVLSEKGKLVAPLSQITNNELILELSELPRLSRAGGKALSNDEFTRAAEMLRLVQIAGGLGMKVDSFVLNAASELIAQAQPASGALAEELLLPREGDFSTVKRQITRLHAVLDDLRNRQQVAKTIDLRFQDQIVVKPKVSRPKK